MSNFSQYRSKEQEFWGLKLDETDLRRIVLRLQAKSQEYKTDTEFKVKTPNSGDSFQSQDPNFFTSEHFPRIIEYIEIRNKKWSDVRFSLKLSASKASLSIEGENVDAVEAIYQSLVRELESYSTNFYSLSKLLNKTLYLPGLVFQIIYSIMIAFVCFTSIIIFIAAIFPLFQIDINAFLLTLSRPILLLVVLIVFILIIKIQDNLSKMFPAVRFTGRIKDNFENNRNQIFAILSILIIPTILGILINLIS